jgi:hypothetical protein
MGQKQISTDWVSVKNGKLNFFEKKKKSECLIILLRFRELKVY